MGENVSWPLRLRRQRSTLTARSLNRRTSMTVAVRILALPDERPGHLCAAVCDVCGHGLNPARRPRRQERVRLAYPFIKAWRRVAANSRAECGYCPCMSSNGEGTY